MGGEGKRLFKIKLGSGRVLGPLDLERIRQLILKNHVTGKEVGREYPSGDWKDVNKIPEIATLLVAKAKGELKKMPLPGTLSSTHVLPGSTRSVAQGAEGLKSFPSLQTISERKLPNINPNDDRSRSKLSMDNEVYDLDPEISSQERDKAENEKKDQEPSGSGEHTIIAPEGNRETAEREPSEIELPPGNRSGSGADEISFGIGTQVPVSQQETIFFQRSSEGPLPLLPKEITRNKGFQTFKKIVAIIALAVAGYQLFFEQNSPQSGLKWEPVKARLPSVQTEKPDTAKSAKLYQAGVKEYLKDNLLNYKAAASFFLAAAEADASNVKAHALLASCYINLIDSSNKDEGYFSIISKLIEMSRAKSIDLFESVISDMEFYLAANKAEAAQQRLLEYERNHKLGTEAGFYLALIQFQKGAFSQAQGWLEKIPDSQIYSPRILYLRGQVAEKMGQPEEALLIYKKSLNLFPDHLKSRLKAAEINAKQGRLRDAGPDLARLLKTPRGLPPKDLALAYFLYGQWLELNHRWDEALGAIEKAVRFDRSKHDYTLEMYTLRARSGDNSKEVKKEARMYYHLREGEQLLIQGRHSDALAQFLMASQAQPDAFVPYVRIGDMFKYLFDLNNARFNYKKAAEMAPNNIDVWSKYLEILIQSYEWDEAQRAMDRFRQLPVNQSAIDKAAADMYQRQNKPIEAQGFYRKAMAREYIDPEVYSAYAKSLMTTKNFKEAPFFFAMALRFDPVNTEALIGTAKCIAETESIDRAIIMLQDELQKGSGARAELLSAIAEFQIQKGNWAEAQITVDQAVSADPENAKPWQVQAKIYLNKEGDRGMLDKALAAYRSYSERNKSDPTGYLERYRIFIKKSQYENAMEELDRIYRVIEKYPNLRYYRGLLYSIMGNRVEATKEFKKEIEQNPGSVPSLIAMGRELVEMGSPQEALNYYNRAIQVQPKNSDARHLAGWASYLVKNYAAALALLRSAVAIDKANPLIYKRIGIVCRELGDV